jgi:hypothetical protein
MKRVVAGMILLVSACQLEPVPRDPEGKVVPEALTCGEERVLLEETLLELRRECRFAGLCFSRIAEAIGDAGFLATPARVLLIFEKVRGIN